jgi:cell division protease FtsH
MGDITTGAANDIERATKVARQMVTEYGMSDTIGPLTLGQKQHEVFLGRDFATQPDYSDQVAFEIDNEVRQMIDQAHDEALEILQEQRVKLDEIAAVLVERETIDREEVERILADVAKRPQRDASVRGAGLAVSRRAVRAQRDQGPGALR